MVFGWEGLSRQNVVKDVVEDCCIIALFVVEEAPVRSAVGSGSEAVRRKVLSIASATQPEQV